MSLDKFCSSISNQLNTGVLILDLEGNIVLWNKFLEIHANKAPETVINQSVYQVFPELPKRWFERKITSVVQLKSPSFCSWEQRHHLFELPHTRPITTASRFMAQNCTFLPIESEAGVEHICVLIEDTTDVCYYQTMLNKTLADLALANRIDGLTQIFNRKHWEECLANEFSRARRYKHELALIMFDLDHFKLLNDTFGHQGGDLVLIEASKVVSAILRSCDLFGRYGGEEFAIILPETDITGACDVAERLRKGLEDLAIEYQGNNIKFTASVGVAVIDENDNRYEDLISNADVALYQAKSAGRNCVRLSQELVACDDLIKLV